MSLSVGCIMILTKFIWSGQGQITITSKTYTKSQILNNHHTKYQGLASCDSVESFFFNDRVSFIIFCCC